METENLLIIAGIGVGLYFLWKPLSEVSDLTGEVAHDVREVYNTSKETIKEVYNMDKLGVQNIYNTIPLGGQVAETIADVIKPDTSTTMYTIDEQNKIMTASTAKTALNLIGQRQPSGKIVKKININPNTGMTTTEFKTAGVPYLPSYFNGGLTFSASNKTDAIIKASTTATAARLIGTTQPSGKIIKNIEMRGGQTITTFK